MAENTNIEWCDHTFNPWMGCTKISPACDNCYAEAMMQERLKKVKWGAKEPRQRTSSMNWKMPLKWDRDARITSTRPRVFCASLADVFDKEAPQEWREDLWSLIEATPHLDWLILTKRPQNIQKLCHWSYGTFPDNVWMGATVEDKASAAQRIKHLGQTPCKVRFLSCEPLMEPVDLTDIVGFCGERLNALTGYIHEHDSWVHSIDWVIAGGESGSRARPTHPDCFRSLRDQCAAAGVPFLFKQWGEWLPIERTPEIENKITMPGQNSGLWAWPDGTRDGWKNGIVSARLGKKTAGRLLDGIEHHQFPSPLKEAA
ncbi:Phage protein Gp37/Gp68 [Pseudovibrio axinellae]|uniref:Phage protein Gp37/Gp68 n=1 Tax=Pseudovibrio axinellae TaxID=989403 RepID=A0A165XEG9_9HYPH|nr:phage Gp37/Gp68 family protein [Pseudovibrio axinellae]KZL17631.1 Phage protein Gp37/Gp68 [Pseudovibrio axinellae]SER45647.1 protein gp37 [Pseudovibrio axinellae]